MDRRFGTFFWGKLISATGIWLHIMVSIIIVFDATGSARAVAAVSAAHFLPQIVLTPWAGRLTDSGRPGLQLSVGRALCALGSLYLAVYFFFAQAGGGEAAVHAIAASAVVGVGLVVGGPAQQAVVPMLVENRELPAAMVLNSVPMTAGRVLGPVLGAVGTQLVSPTAAFAFAAGANVFFAVGALRLRLGRIAAVTASDPSVRAGLRHIIADRPLLLLLISVAAVACAAEPSLTLAAPLTDELEAGSALVGALTSAFGVGSVVGLLVAGHAGPRWGQEKCVFAGLWLNVVALVALTLCVDATQATAAAVLLGAGFSITVTTASTAIQVRTPEGVRGRVMSWWMIAFIGSRPVAAMIEGFLADLWSVRGALALTVLALVPVAIVCSPRRLTTHR